MPPGNLIRSIGSSFSVPVKQLELLLISLKSLVHDVLLPENNSIASGDPRTAERSRPRCEFKEVEHTEHCNPRGRKRKHEPADAKNVNWTVPHLWTQIEAAARNAGPEMSPTDIVRILQTRNPADFNHLTSQVLGSYIERPALASSRWKSRVLERVGFRPGGHATRSGVLVRHDPLLESTPEVSHALQDKHPDLIIKIVAQIRLLRAAGIRMNVVTARAIILAHIRLDAPDLLSTVALSDGSLFKCSDAFVRKFLYVHLRYRPRAGTRAVQKLLANYEDQCRKSFLRIAYTTYHRRITHACFRVNIDQTQVVVQDTGASTFEEEGAKQVDITGKEEKRAWTAVVGVSASGNPLPLQIIMKGATSASLPRADAPGMAEALRRGFVFSTNPKNYWSSLLLMKTYVESILVPYWRRKMDELALPHDQPCILQLDVWSVHRSAEFRLYMRNTWPWITLDFVPGGCTGIWQPCDVGIQRPFKLAIKRAQLEDVVAETMSQLGKDDHNGHVKLDVTIGTLRKRSVAWLLAAHDAISDAESVRKAFEHCVVGSFNLSHESVTSDDAHRALFDLARSDRAFWDELNCAEIPDSNLPNLISIPTPAEMDNSPFDDALDDEIDADLDTSIEPAELFARIFGQAVVDPAPRAEELDPGEVVVEPELGRGKRRKTGNKLYNTGGYEAH
jgi:hypothetical protein